MNEIEIKIKVDTLEEILEKLKSLGCEISTSKYQKDTIFVKDINNVVSREPNSVWIRIRQTDDRSILNYKKQKENIAESKEIEFEISDFQSGLDFIKELGYEKWIIVEKKRIESKYNDINICLDYVTNLGYFVELEILTTENNKTDYYEKKLSETAIELGLDIDDRVCKHYDTMLDELRD